VTMLTGCQISLACGRVQLLRCESGLLIAGHVSTHFLMAMICCVFPSCIAEDLLSFPIAMASHDLLLVSYCANLTPAAFRACCQQFFLFGCLAWVTRFLFPVQRRDGKMESPLWCFLLFQHPAS
jgi:hypothetical protein